jgi:hypothetical protein
MKVLSSKYLPVTGRYANMNTRSKKHEAKTTVANNIYVCNEISLVY